LRGRTYERVFLKHNVKMWVSTAAVTVTATLALAPASNAANVCNEAENSPRGGYVVSGGIVDPNPPAFLRDVTQMRVGNGKGKGLDHAADVSPALRQCGLPDGGGETVVDPGDGGGTDPGYGNET
jgi:hypothetical protein